MKQFGDNVNFCKFLNTFNTDEVFKSALIAEDYSPINTFPGLCEGERKFLKNVDWPNVEVGFEKDPGVMFNDWTVAATDVTVTESCSPGYCTKKIEVKDK